MWIAFLLSGCGGKCIEIETPLYDDRVVKYVKLSGGELIFKDESDVLSQLSKDDFQPANLTVPGSTYETRLCAPGPAESHWTYRCEMSYEAMEDLLGIDPNQWVLPERLGSKFLNDPARLTVLRVNPEYLYKVENESLLNYICGNVLILVHAYRLPADSRVNKAVFGNADSRIGDCSLPIIYSGSAEPYMENAVNGFRYLTCFMREQVGYFIEAQGITQEEFINLLLSVFL